MRDGQLMAAVTGMKAAAQKASDCKNPFAKAQLAEGALLTAVGILAELVGRELERGEHGKKE